VPAAGVTTVRRGHRLRVVSLALVLTGAQLATACTDDPAPTPETNRPLVAPLAIEKEPLWPGSTTLPAAGRYEIRGQSLLGFGDSVESGAAFAVMDVATGELLWRLREHDALPTDGGRRLGGSLPFQWPVTVVDDDTDWTVIVPYSDAQGQGAAGLSSADGSVLWTLPVVPNHADYHYVAAADENIVVSLVSSVPGFELGRTQVVATRTVDKAKAWEAAGMWPSAVVGDTVLGVRASQPGQPGDREVDSDSVVVALDARTGQEKWNLGDRYPTSNVYLTLGDVAVVFTGESSNGFIPRAVIIDASTGEELADLGETAICVDDGATLVACRRSGNDDMMIFDVRARKIGATTTKGPFSGGWHGYFFKEGRVVDREGHPVIDGLPGDYVEAMSGEYALVGNEHKQELTVHRVHK
jgi:hypothetical protein